jgi:hypothetical protein
VTLPSWNDTPTRAALLDFVEAAARDAPREERAVFDNEGTLGNSERRHLDAPVRGRSGPPVPAGARAARRRGAGVRLVAGPEDALEHAKQQGWTVVSVKADWATVFATT